MYHNKKDSRRSELIQRPPEESYSGRWVTQEIPKDKIPDESLDPRATYLFIHDELNLDCNPSLNLASFVTTWMEDEAEKIIIESLNKNYIDEDEYPQTRIIHDRVIRMMGNMCHSDDSAGTATIGSSEAIMLALLVHKWNWRKRREAEGKDFSRPNIVFGADVHSCWEKFALYFDVEMRVIPMTEDKYTINGKDIIDYVDENTIAVGAVLGTTFTGQIDDFTSINKYLLKLKKEQNLDIPIHVDAASGGFVAPFAFPDLKWDFRLEQVKSINISNHKFGLVYVGMGTVLFKNKEVIPEELIFHINYLGGSMPNYSLNFSKPSSLVIAQYYNFLRLGKTGYHNIINNILKVARYVEAKLLETGKFKILTDCNYLPVTAVCLLNDNKYNVFQISKLLHEYGWVVPAYTLPPKAEHIAVLRIVCRERFTLDMAENFIEDVNKVLLELEQNSSIESATPSTTTNIC
ncbi:glutamate decarboxylase [Lentisphaerota bacterium WC36G]|nr:glutamate decarboxylase [Lentisphaerae bacterium WC36]